MKLPPRENIIRLVAFLLTGAFVSYAGALLSCAHAPDGESCKDRCEYQFPGEGWRWAIFLPVFPTGEWSVCMDACKDGKTYHRLPPTETP